MLLKQIIVGRDISNLTEIELAVEHSCKNLKVCEIKTYFVTLAVSETASNIIRHSTHSSDTNDDIAMGIFSLKNSLKIVLEDVCEPLSAMVISQLAQRDGSIAPYDTTIQNIPEHGWGMDLISHAADKITYARINAHNVYELEFTTEVDA